MLINHYRDKDHIEADFVLEKSGSVAGVEVKASTGVKPEVFNGLKRFQDATVKAFACRNVLHDGERIQRVGLRLFAMPVSQIWF